MSEMAKHVHTTVRYDGPALSGHQMDVQELAPALLALAEMAQLANKLFNGDKASMQVLVKADIEQKCFQLDIHLAQTLLESAKHLFGTDEYKTAKEIAEFLDLLLPGGVAGGVFWFWRRVWGASPPSAEAPIAFQTEQHGGQTTLINAPGGAPITVNNNTYMLATDPAMMELGKRVLKPLERDGYDQFGLYQDGKPTTEWSNEEASRFIENAPSVVAPVDSPEDLIRTPIRGRVSVKTRRNEGRAQWEVKWASRAVWAAMDDTDWLDRFQAGDVHVEVPYWLDVTMEMATSRTDPDAAPSYAIKKVHEVLNGGAGKQGDWLSDES